MSNENMEMDATFNELDNRMDALDELVSRRNCGDMLQTAGAVVILAGAAVKLVKFMKKKFIDSRKEVFEVAETVED